MYESRFGSKFGPGTKPLVGCQFGKADVVGQVQYPADPFVVDRAACFKLGIPGAMREYNMTVHAITFAG